MGWSQTTFAWSRRPPQVLIQRVVVDDRVVEQNRPPCVLLHELVVCDQPMEQN